MGLRQSLACGLMILSPAVQGINLDAATSLGANFAISGAAYL